MNFKHFSVLLSFLLVHTLALFAITAHGSSKPMKLKRRHGQSQTTGLLKLRQDDGSGGGVQPLANAGVCYHDTETCENTGNGAVLPGASYWDGCLSVYINADDGLVCTSCEPNDIQQDCMQLVHGNCLELMEGQTSISGCFVNAVSVSTVQC